MLQLYTSINDEHSILIKLKSVCKACIAFAIYTPKMMAQDGSGSTREQINDERLISQ